MLIVVVIAISIAVIVGRGDSSERYPLHLDVTASVFSSSENASAGNAFISNAQSAWDKHWRADAARENQYYVALPVSDYLGNGSFNPENARIPWHKDNIPGQSELKNRWVKVTRKVDGHTLTAYGQWEDVGPSDRTDDSVNDLDYVWGPKGHDPSSPLTVKPKNTFGVRAGIDLSPAMAQALQIDGSGEVSWRFVDANDVSEGPWTQKITTSPPRW